MLSFFTEKLFNTKFNISTQRYIKVDDFISTLISRIFDEIAYSIYTQRALYVDEKFFEYKNALFQNKIL